MKKILATILAGLMLFALAGCGKYAPPDPGTNGGTDVPAEPDDPNVPENPDEPQEGAFTVKLVYNDQPFQPEETVYAIWTNGTQLFRASFGADGVARSEEPDGPYRVTLSAAPEGYTYNPNIYTAANNRKSVTIEIYKLIKTTGKGDDLYNSIDILALGTYRATFTKPDQQIYFQYKPRRPGRYSVESIMDTSANEINPLADIYTSNAQFKQFLYTQDGGATSSSFTKNFRFEITFNLDEIGGAFAFGIRLKTRVNNFTCNIDFTLKSKGAYDRDDAVYVPVAQTETLTKAPNESGTFRYVAHFSPIKLLDGKRVRYNEETRYYEYLADEAAGTYKTMYAVIKKDSEVLETESHSGFLDGLVRLKLQGEGGLFKDYYSMINAYAAMCNDAGAYPVTEELRQFLQDYSVSQRLFRDGDGIAEETGSGYGPEYSAAEADQWMFNCGIYV